VIAHGEDPATVFLHEFRNRLELGWSDRDIGRAGAAAVDTFVGDYPDHVVVREVDWMRGGTRKEEVLWVIDVPVPSADRW